jgi:ABC-type polysaccharide transport system permease subunit
MININELCEKFNEKWDNIEENKRFLYFVGGALVWSFLFTYEPIWGLFLGLIAIYIRLQRYDS